MTQRYYPWTFLPENTGDPASVGSSGVTRADVSPAAWLADLAGGMLTACETPACAAPDVLNADARCLRALETESSGEAVWRGTLAAALLWDAWLQPMGAPRLTTTRVEDEDAGFTGFVLQSMAGKSHALTLLTLECSDSAVLPFGFLSKKTLITPAANLTALRGVLPERIAWYDAIHGTFADPCDYLSDQDRILLSVMLMQLHLSAVTERPVLAAALGRFITALEESSARHAAPPGRADLPKIETHLLIAAGLQPESTFDMLTIQQADYAQGENRILSLLGAPTPAVSCTAQSVWLWRGTPFMRTDVHHGYERLPGEAAEAAITEMTEELDRLLCNSPAWCARTARRVQALVADSAAESLRTVGEKLVSRLTQLMHAPGEEVVLTWPWTEDSGAVRLLASESLGEDCTAALKPFSDKLALVDAQSVAALGISSLQLFGDGTVSGEMTEFAAVPPLSAPMAQLLARRDDCAPVLLMDSMQMLCHADASGVAGVTAQYALQGMRKIVFRRRYDEDDILTLEEAQTPTVAVWPSIPLTTCGWRSYYVYAGKSAVTVETLENGAWKAGEERHAADLPDTAWSIIHTTDYPACLLLRMGEDTLGALPNLLPEFRPPLRPHAVIAIDMGASGTAVAISQSGDVMPMSCGSTRRMLMTGCQSLLPDSVFIDGYPVQPIVSSAVETFSADRNAWQTPVLDARIATQSPFSDQAKDNLSRIRWGLKWGVSGDSDALRRQYLANLMQTAVQTAVIMGSRSVTWRISMPADMAAEGKRALLRTMEELAVETAQRTGIPLANNIPPVTWADESVAIGHFFRKVSMQPVHGAFMALDIGGGSANLLTWLRGTVQPTYTMTLPLGAQHLLLEAMLANPACMMEDFAELPDPAFQERIRHLTEQFTRAQTDVKALEIARFMLDDLLARDLGQMHQYMNSVYTQGSCTRTQALLLLQVSFLMMLAGALQEQIYRDTTLNDMLPPFMEICLAGRGAQILYGFNTALQRRLSGFVRLPLDRMHPTHEFAFVGSDAMKLEAALGLARMPETSTGEPEDYVPSPRRFGRSIDPVDMLRRYLWHFRMELPQAAMRLFPHAFDDQGGLTQAADARLRACAANAFAGKGDSVEQNCSAWLLTLLQWMA